MYNLFELSTPQREAAEYMGGPSLISAGPGTGKTRVLTAKAMFMTENGVQPERLLAITFTNKATEEVIDRIVKYTGLPKERFPGIKTSHSWCAEVLRQFGPNIGLNTPFSIFGTGAQEASCKIVLRDLNIEKKYAQQIISCISLAKSSGDPLWYISNFQQSQLLQTYFINYEALLMKQNAVDFDGILLHTRNLLRDNPSVREQIRQRYDHILVDEYQDWNNVQNQILASIVNNGNVTVVGDDYQSIYSWRGSNPLLFTGFTQQYPTARVFKLEQNYRCSSVITEAAYELIKRNNNQIDKRIFSTKQGPYIDVLTFTSAVREAVWVAAECKILHEKYHIPFEKIGVISRKKKVFNPLEKEFLNSGIPHTLVDSVSFFERSEIKDVRCYLTSAINAKDDFAFERILNRPKRGAGPKVQAILGKIQQSGVSLREACKIAVSRNMLKPKVTLALIALENELTLMANDSPVNAVNRIKSNVGYNTFLQTKYQDDYFQRVNNIQFLVKLAAGYQKLDKFVQELILMADRIDSPSEDQGVKMTTSHSSKGLEYQVVFLIGAEQGILPDYRSLNGQLDEERRVMFVSMTRAEEKLYISYSTFRDEKQTSPSVFLNELPPNLILKYGR